jgi:hypothetical protein
LSAPDFEQAWRAGARLDLDAILGPDVDPLRV